MCFRIFFTEHGLSVTDLSLTNEFESVLETNSLGRKTMIVLFHVFECTFGYLFGVIFFYFVSCSPTRKNVRNALQCIPLIEKDLDVSQLYTSLQSNLLSWLQRTQQVRCCVQNCSIQAIARRDSSTFQMQCYLRSIESRNSQRIPRNLRHQDVERRDDERNCTQHL